MDIILMTRFKIKTEKDRKMMESSNTSLINVINTKI